MELKKLKKMQEEIYRLLDSKAPYEIYYTSQEDLVKTNNELVVALRCLEFVEPIDYKTIKTKDPKKYLKLYDVTNVNGSRPTLEGFKAELKQLTKNNNDVYSTSSKKKIIVGSDQYQCYVDALQMIKDTLHVHDGVEIAETFNVYENQKYILVGKEIKTVSDLLAGVINSSIELEIEKEFIDTYISFGD